MTTSTTDDPFAYAGYSSNDSKLIATIAEERRLRETADKIRKQAQDLQIAHDLLRSPRVTLTVRRAMPGGEPEIEFETVSFASEEALRHHMTTGLGGIALPWVDEKRRVLVDRLVAEWNADKAAMDQENEECGAAALDRKADALWEQIDNLVTKIDALPPSTPDGALAKLDRVLDRAHVLYLDADDEGHIEAAIADLRAIVRGKSAPEIACPA